MVAVRAQLALLACVVLAFGLGIFNQTDAFWIAGGAALALGAPVLVLSLLATREVSRREPR